MSVILSFCQILSLVLISILISANLMCFGVHVFGLVKGEGFLEKMIRLLREDDQATIRGSAKMAYDSMVFLMSFILVRV